MGWGWGEGYYVFFFILKLGRDGNSDDLKGKEIVIGIGSVILIESFVERAGRRRMVVMMVGEGGFREGGGVRGGEGGGNLEFK